MGCQQSSPQDITFTKKRKIHPHNSQNPTKPKQSLKKFKTQTSELKTNAPCVKEIVLCANNDNFDRSQKGLIGGEGAIEDIQQGMYSSLSSTNSGLIDYSIDYSVDHYKKREEQIRLMKQKIKKIESKSRPVGKDNLVMMSSSYKKVSISGLMNGKTTVEMKDELNLSDNEESFDEALSSDNEFSRSLDSFFQSESSISIYKIDGEDGDLGFAETSRILNNEEDELYCDGLERNSSEFEIELSFQSLKSLNSLNELIC